MKESNLKQSIIFTASKSLLVVRMQYIKPNKAKPNKANQHGSK